MDNEPSFQRYYHSILQSIDGLQERADKLERFSTLTLYITVFQLAFFVIEVAVLRRLSLSLVGYSVNISISLTIIAVIIFLSINFDVLKRKGDAEFEALSEELHEINIKSKDADIDSENIIASISYNARRTTKRYAAARNFPIFPGAFGPALIIIFNTALFIIAVYSLSV